MSPLGFEFKTSDEHPRLFHMGVPPPDTVRFAWYRVRDTKAGNSI